MFKRTTGTRYGRYRRIHHTVLLLLWVTVRITVTVGVRVTGRVRLG